MTMVGEGEGTKQKNSPMKKKIHGKRRAKGFSVAVIELRHSVTNSKVHSTVFRVYV